jgi:transcriptional regulator of acetoin/glycerol metabolism
MLHGSDLPAPSGPKLTQLADSVLETAEREALRTALAGHEGNRRELAARLGVSERTLYRKLRRYGLS